MKKSLLVAALTTGLTFGILNSALANELSEAPADVVEQAIKECKEWAKEDEIPAADIYNFVLKCVNEDLNDQEFKAVAKIKL